MIRCLDLAAMRKRLVELKRQQNRRRPVVSTIDLSRF